MTKTSMLKVAVQMDPLEHINITGDSTFALMLEAQARNYPLFVYNANEISLNGTEVIAYGQDVSVRDEKDNHAQFGARKRVNLADYDVVLMRQDPPFDMHYITATHILEHLPKSTYVTNHPANVRNAPEKIFVTEFSDLMPATLISRHREEIELFRAKHGDVVMKPLYGNGGRSVFLVKHDDVNFSSLFDLFCDVDREPWVTQQFLPAIKFGDKRIILVDGKPVGAINRMPSENDIRSNMVRGGQAQRTELTPREIEICARLEPRLRELGLLFVGIDVIDGHLTEINVTSPTGIRAIERLSGHNIAVDIWDKIEEKIQHNT